MLKQEILYYEDILLRTLCFDLAVDHPYVSLIHSVKFIHESHARARPSKSSTAVEMADRAKAKSITQAAWGFINDSLMSPLCLVAKPELIAASAFLLAVSHRLSESPPSYPDQGGNHQEPHNIENDLVDFNRFLNLPPRDGPEEGSIQEPWWKAFQIESLDEIHQVANAMLDQYTLSVCDYIRDRAGKLARFPGPSFLRGPVEAVEAQPSHTTQADSGMIPGNSDERRTPPDREEDPSRAISSTPSRALMSDNMDLGTPNESASPSPKSRRVASPTGPTDEKSPTNKRSRSPESSARPSKNPKLDLPSSASSQPTPKPPSASPPPLPPSIPHQPSPPPPSDPHPLSTAQSPPSINKVDVVKETEKPVAGAVASSDSSLSDMEDGELD